MRTLVLSSLLIVGCSGGTDPSETGDPGDVCPFSATDVSIAEGATDIFVDADYDRLIVELDTEGVVVFLYDAELDMEIAGEDFVEGTTHTWSVSGSLGTNTTYEVRGRKDDCVETFSSFMTGPWRYAETGGKTFSLDFEGATGPGSKIIGTFTDGYEAALWNRDGDNDWWTAVPVADDQQDDCIPTTDLQGGFANSLLVLRLTDVPFIDENDPARWVNTEITALVPADDPTRWDRVRVTGELDVTALETVGGDCSVFEAFGETCGPCSDGKGSMCIPMEMTGVTATELSISPQISAGGCGE